MAVNWNHVEGAHDNRFDTDLKTSMLRAVIERLKEELRKEQILLEEKKRELEFLQKGGNPLEYQYWNGCLRIRSP